MDILAKTVLATSAVIALAAFGGVAIALASIIMVSI
jgi:hypothetical protein